MKLNNKEFGSICQYFNTKQTIREHTHPQVGRYLFQQRNYMLKAQPIYDTGIAFSSKKLSLLYPIIKKNKIFNGMGYQSEYYPNGRQFARIAALPPAARTAWCEQICS